MKEELEVFAELRDAGFRLVQSDSRCFLVHEDDGERWELTHTTCAPE